MIRTALGFVLLAFVAGAAAAQTPSTPPPQAPGAAGNGAANQAACPPGVGADAPTVGSGQSGSNLSDKLSRSNGVICPPAGVDPQMRVPAPQEGRTPVIPPPGTPGGDQHTIPK